MSRSFLIVLFIFFVSACESEGVKNKESLSIFHIGTFNIQFLADDYGVGETPRGAADYGHLARLITDNELDLIAVQEIESQKSLELLEENGLPESFEPALGASGYRQRVGVLYDIDAGIGIRQARELKEADGFTPAHWSNVRYPFLAEVEVSGAFRFLFLSVHLKAGIARDDAEQRRSQVEELVAWAENQELPFVIAGDFNDTFEGISEGVDTLEPLEEATEIGCFLTSDVQDFTSLQFFDLIDHVFVSPELDDIYIEESAETIKFDQDSSYEGAVVSDHRPVRCSFAFSGE